MLGPAFSTVFFLSIPGGEEPLADIPSNQLPGYKTSGYLKTIPPGKFYNAVAEAGSKTGSILP
jgi:hypothetical protein